MCLCGTCEKCKHRESQRQHRARKKIGQRLDAGAILPPNDEHFPLPDWSEIFARGIYRAELIWARRIAYSRR